MNGAALNLTLVSSAALSLAAVGPSTALESLRPAGVVLVADPFLTPSADLSDGDSK